MSGRKGTVEAVRCYHQHGGGEQKRLDSDRAGFASFRILI